MKRRAVRMPLVGRIRDLRRGAHAVPADAAPGPAVDRRWVAMLHEVDWLPGGTLTIRGWAYLKGVENVGEGHVILELAEPGCGRVLRLNAESVEEPEVNATSGDTVDHASAAFVAQLGAGTTNTWPPSWTGATGPLDVRIEIPTAEGTYRGPFTQRSNAGSAGALRPGTWGESFVVTPRWSGSEGLGLILAAKPVLAVGAGWADGEVYLDIEASSGYVPVRASLDGPEPAPATVHLDSTGPGTLRVRISVNATASDAGVRRTWAMTLADAGGRREKLQWAGPDLGNPIPLGSGLLVNFLGDGTVRVAHDHSVLVVTSANCVDGPEPGLHVTGTLSDPTRRVRSVLLSGPRVQVPAASWHVTADGTFHAVMPLESRSWDAQVRPLPPGRYLLRLETESGQAIEPLVGPYCLGAFGRREYGRVHNTRLSRKGGHLEIEVSAPLAPDEIGAYNQRRLRAEAAQASDEPVGTFFVSWYGRNVSDNPLAIYREMASRGLGEPYTWEVTDLSVAIPEGTEAAVVGSRNWWHASTSARYVVVNVWQRKDFLKRKGQVVVQTWHGTPYKLLGLDRPTKAGRPGSIRLIERDTQAWNHLISQNPHSSETYRRAYLWDRPILEIGYPRNDLLARGEPSERARVRELLGLTADQVAILYAPTWREDDRSKVGVLDVHQFARKLGPGHPILLRGHSITLRGGKPVESESIIDVSSYPDAADLMIAADVLVTDYSSIMFDFSVTGRPILFYVPDLADYAGTAARQGRIRKTSPGTNAEVSSKFRGVYFELGPLAPGPLITNQRDLVTAVRNLDAIRRQYASKYATWRSTFNPHDDGLASRRLVDELFPDDILRRNP